MQSCTFELSAAITEPASLSVKLNGKALSLNPADGNGFALDPTGTVITLLGTACAIGDTKSQLEIGVDCGVPESL